MKEVHVCPILMRTVIFENERCTEKCNEQDCPIENFSKNIEGEPV